MISVIVCTWNRSHALLRCLESLERQALNPLNQVQGQGDVYRYEVVVVDNNSTDGTPDAVAEFAAKSDMTVTLVREPKQGLSHARNAGIEAASGDILAFIDDDCAAEPGYLAALSCAFEETGAGLVAGKVTSVPPDGLVTDLPRGFNAAKKLAHLYLGPKRRPMWPHEYALGGNIAVRKAVAEQVGGFGANLGYAGGSKVVGEDTEFCDRVRASGALMVWEPNAAVLHRVGPERLSKTAYRKAAFYYGRGSLTRRLGKTPKPAARARAAIVSVATVPLYGVAWVLSLWSPGRRFEIELKMMSALGKIGTAVRGSSR